MSGHYQNTQKAADQVWPQRALYRAGSGTTRPSRTQLDPEGLFAWVDTGVDGWSSPAGASNVRSPLAPGALFSPLQAPSTRMRINVTRWTPESSRFFASVL